MGARAEASKITYILGANDGLAFEFTPIKLFNGGAQVGRRLKLDKALQQLWLATCFRSGASRPKSQ